MPDATVGKMVGTKQTQQYSTQLYVEYIDLATFLAVESEIREIEFSVWCARSKEEFIISLR